MLQAFLSAVLALGPARTLIQPQRGLTEKRPQSCLFRINIHRNQFVSFRAGNDSLAAIIEECAQAGDGPKHEKPYCQGENNRNDLATGRTKTAIIRPILMDREIPRLQARLDELTKLSAEPGLTADQKKEFIEVTDSLKLLTDRRALLLARTGDDYVSDPPKLPTKP